MEECQLQGQVGFDDQVTVLREWESVLSFDREYGNNKTSILSKSGLILLSSVVCFAAPSS